MSQFLVCSISCLYQFDYMLLFFRSAFNTRSKYSSVAVSKYSGHSTSIQLQTERGMLIYLGNV